MKGCWLWVLVTHAVLMSVTDPFLLARVLFETRAQCVRALVRAEAMEQAKETRAHIALSFQCEKTR